jgi:DNA-binding NtrC family response regulator
MGEFARENNKPIDDITSEAINALMAYAWPGNVRELRNAIERMIVMAHGAKLTVHDLPGIIREQTQSLPGLGIKPASSIRDANRQMIITALDAAGGNRTKAARQLGISRRTLHRKLHEFGLPARRPQPVTKPPVGEKTPAGKA